MEGHVRGSSIFFCGGEVVLSKSKCKKLRLFFHENKMENTEGLPYSKEKTKEKRSINAPKRQTGNASGTSRWT